jgi:hypothetical protein
MEQQQTAEKVFYQKGGVTITSSRLIMHNKTYIMRNVSSFMISETKPSKVAPIVFIIIGCLSMIPDSEIRYAGLTVAMIGLAWLLLLRNEYAVRISTNGGATNSLASKDKQDIQTIVNALHEAFIFRG